MKLTLSEELLLLSLDDEKGSAVACANYALPSAMAGAVLYELAERGIVEFDEDKVNLCSGAKTGDEVLDLALEGIGIPKKPQPVKWFIAKIAQKDSKIKELLYTKLVAGGILAKDERKFLWVIPYSRYPTKDVLPEADLRKRIIDSVFGERTVEERDYFLLSLIKAAKLEKEVFPRELVKEATVKLDLISRDEKIGKVVNAIAKEIQIAIIMVVALSATVAVST